MARFENDRELQAAFRAGHPQALDQVYRAYAPVVDRAVRRFAQRSGEASLAQPSVIADLLQEIFARAFSPSARRAYDGARDLGPYLVTIARNCFLDSLRTSGRELLTQPEELAPSQDADVPERDDWTDPKVVAVVTGYLQSLPPDLQGIYRQRFVLDRSQVDASSALGSSRRAIRTGEERLRRGLRKALVRAGISLREL
jgi:RNA polymerase sigma factor (sigma-70 family)